METRSQAVSAKDDMNVTIDIIPGHFATNHSHVNYYVDMTSLKTRHKMARDAAVALAGRFQATTPVDTIICLEGTEMIGAFLAEELSKQGHMQMNSGNDICVLSPEFNANNQIIFRDNIQKQIWGKNILILIASASTGKTIFRIMECLAYYNGRPVGAIALFSATSAVNDLTVQSLFSMDDIPNYRTFEPSGCEICAKHQKIDAIVNSYGYSKI